MLQIREKTIFILEHDSIITVLDLPMISRTLVKLIDQAITPAIVLLSTRVISVVGLSYFLGIPLTIDARGFSFPTIEDYIKINSYSTLAMIVVLTVGLVYILVKALVFHDTHISPQLTAKVFVYRLSTFIQSSYDIYSQATVWLSYSFLMLMMTGIFAYTDFIYNWVFYINAVLTLASTGILIFDVENEIFMKKNQETYFEDDTLVEIEGGLYEEN